MKRPSAISMGTREKRDEPSYCARKSSKQYIIGGTFKSQEEVSCERNRCLASQSRRYRSVRDCFETLFPARKRERSSPRRTYSRSRPTLARRPFFARRRPSSSAKFIFTCRQVLSARYISRAIHFNGLSTRSSPRCVSLPLSLFLYRPYRCALFPRPPRKENRTNGRESARIGYRRDAAQTRRGAGDASRAVR